VPQQPTPNIFVYEAFFFMDQTARRAESDQAASKGQDATL
jgi:hypothetical protein